MTPSDSSSRSDAHASNLAQARAKGHLPSAEGVVMLHFAVVFFIIALVAALLGFASIAAGAASIAQILFVVFVVMAIAGFVVGEWRKR